MGLFEDLKSAVKKSAAEAVDNKKASFASTSIGSAAYSVKDTVSETTGSKLKPGTIVPWPREVRHESVVVDPDVSGTFYTYYPEPLRKLKTGDRFMLEAVPGDLTLTSKYSGNSLNTHESRMIAYMYDGEIVGASTCCYRMTRELVEQGYRVFCHAEKTGVLDKNIPTVTIYGTFKSKGYEISK